MTDAVVNPIIPGLPWEQEFTTDPLLTPIGTELRVVLRPFGQTRAPAIAVSLDHPSAGQHILELTAAETATAVDCTALVGDLVLYQGQNPIRALCRVELPVEQVDATGVGGA